MKSEFCARRGMLPLIAGVLFGAASISMSAPAALAADDTLRVGQLADVTAFDPYKLNPTTYVLTNLLYDKLIYRDQNGEVHPQLAKSWELSEGGKTITFHLQENAKFHDGRPVTAKDVVFSIEYAKDPASAAVIRPMAQLAESAEAIDDHTVVLHTRASEDVLYDFLDMLYVLDSEHPDGVETLGNGSGPYRLTANMPGVGAEFTRNEDYWGAKPNFARIELKVLPDAYAAVAQMRSGSVDFLTDISLDSLKQIEGTQFRQGISASEYLVLNVGVNISKPPLDNPKVREAISLAMDRERIANEIGGSGAVVKCLPWVSRDLLPEEQSPDLCPYDPEKAKALIDEAGAAGSTVEILTGGQTNDRLALMAQVMQASFADIGLNVRISDLSNPAFNARFRPGDFELTSHNYGRAARSPATLLLSAIVFASANPMQYRSESYDKAVTAMTTLPPDSPEAQEGRRQVDKELLEQNWVISVASVPMRWTSVPNLTGVEFTLDGMPLFNKASFD